MKEISVKATPAQVERVNAELARGKGEREEYLSVRTTGSSVIACASELRSLADGLESSFSEDEELLRMQEKRSNAGKELSPEQGEFGLTMATESNTALVKALRDAADKADPFPFLRNRAMARSLAKGEAIDLASYYQEDGSYLLPAGLDIEDKDLCDATREVWIWAVGKNRTTGERRAGPHAMTDRFYGNGAKASGWDCEWLR